ncbi:MAG: hypothetical protein WCE25_11580 [Nitrososphaeraceae archaeon]
MSNRPIRANNANIVYYNNLEQNITGLFDPMDSYVPLANNDKFKVFITLVCSLNNAEYLYILDSMYRSIRKSEMT